eukprot:scaffold312544_cov25-Prasinocladus_malaysianus.AAC.1
MAMETKCLPYKRTYFDLMRKRQSDRQGQEKEAPWHTDHLVLSRNIDFFMKVNESQSFTMHLRCEDRK